MVRDGFFGFNVPTPGTPTGDCGNRYCSHAPCKSVRVYTSQFCARCGRRIRAGDWVQVQVLAGAAQHQDCTRPTLEGQMSLFDASTLFGGGK